jgi:hypothetical protein
MEDGDTMSTNGYGTLKSVTLIRSSFVKSAQNTESALSSGIMCALTCSGRSIRQRYRPEHAHYLSVKPRAPKLRRAWRSTFFTHHACVPRDEASVHTPWGGAQTRRHCGWMETSGHRKGSLRRRAHRGCMKRRCNWQAKRRLQLPSLNVVRQQ